MKGSESAMPQLTPINMTITEASERLTSYINGLDEKVKTEVELLDGFDINEFINEYRESGRGEKWIVQSLNGFYRDVEKGVNKTIREKEFYEYLQSLTEDEQAVLQDIHDIHRAKNRITIYRQWRDLGYTIISLLKQFNDLPNFWRLFIIGRLSHRDESEFVRYCGGVRIWYADPKHVEFLIDFNNVLKEVNGGRGSP